MLRVAGNEEFVLPDGLQELMSDISREVLLFTDRKLMSMVMSKK